MTQPTPRPVLIPAGALPQRQTEQLWSRDRGALLSCGAEKGALLDFYGRLMRNLRGNPS